MNILSTLKKMRDIQPDAHYQMRSRSIILRTAPPKAPISAWGWVLGNVESAASLALAGLCLFLIFAGFSIWKSFSPLGIARPDLTALRAEAEAIDIQIQLAGLEYQESTAPVAAAALQAKPATPSMKKSGTTSAPLVTDEHSSSSAAEVSSTPALSIDEALQKLSE